LRFSQRTVSYPKILTCQPQYEPIVDFGDYRYLGAKPKGSSFAFFFRFAFGLAFDSVPKDLSGGAKPKLTSFLFESQGRSSAAQATNQQKAIKAMTAAGMPKNMKLFTNHITPQIMLAKTASIIC